METISLNDRSWTHSNLLQPNITILHTPKPHSVCIIISDHILDIGIFFIPNIDIGDPKNPYQSGPNREV